MNDDDLKPDYGMFADHPELISWRLELKLYSGAVIGKVGTQPDFSALSNLLQVGYCATALPRRSSIKNMAKSVAGGLVASCRNISVT